MIGEQESVKKSWI